MGFQDYPNLTQNEFSEACHHLEGRYCRATLGPLRRRWKLRACTALDRNFSFESEYTTYVQIIRPLESSGSEKDDELSLDLGKFSISQPEGSQYLMPDDAMLDAEETDEAVITKQDPVFNNGFVTYEIHLHPTYRVPCLWFSLHDLPLDEPAFNIDTVFRRLVPDEYKEGLRGLSGLGGISADHHPITGLPAFFVHPCLVGEGMAGFQCTRENYLVIWMGLVGGCVGLWVPKEMAVQ
jgi:ubiquitin-like-conjugating enzyme ATG10